MRQTLDDLDKDGGDCKAVFDQFEGKTTDFDMDLYTVKMPDYVSPEAQAHANKVEREIMGHANNRAQAEDDAILAIDDGAQLARRERKTSSEQHQTEEQLYGTAVPKGQRADESTFARTQALAEQPD